MNVAELIEALQLLPADMQISQHTDAGLRRVWDVDDLLIRVVGGQHPTLMIDFETHQPGFQAGRAPTLGEYVRRK